MGMKNSVPKFWDWECEWKTVFPTFGIGNGNEKQCSQPTLVKNWPKSLGKKLGMGIPAHAFLTGLLLRLIQKNYNWCWFWLFWQMLEISKYMTGNWKELGSHYAIFNRPCVAGAVLQTSLSLIQWVILFLQTFKTSINPNRKIWRADILRECLPPTICHMSCVTCHVSGVRCQVSQFFSSFFGQSGGAIWWRVCYQL